MTDRITELKRRLNDAASIGLDCSPGDPLCAEAIGYIERLELDIQILNLENFLRQPAPTHPDSFDQWQESINDAHDNLEELRKQRKALTIKSP